jgi:cytochrome P450
MELLLPVIPKVRTRGVLGDLKAYVANPLTYLDEKQKSYGDIFSFRLAHRNLIVVNHPDYVRHILQDNHRNYRKSLAYRKLKLLLGNGLFTNEGESWLAQRRLAQPAFHKERLNVYMDTMIQEAREMSNRWCTQNDVVPLLQESTLLTLKIISKCLLGIGLNHEGGVVQDHLPYALDFMIKRVTSTLNLPIHFPVRSHLRFKKAVNSLNSLILNIIRDKKTAGAYGDDLLSMLMNAKDEQTGEQMSDKQLRDEILTFFLAGHETTAVTLAWAIYLICNHPEVYEKVKKEAQAVFAIEATPMEYLKGLTYTRKVIQETMRLVSPIWVMGREALQDDQLGSYPIAKGTSIIFSPFLIHRHPDFWPDAETFNPERFAENTKMPHPFAYFPFGGGPRLCIGNNFALTELQLILGVIFNQFDFELRDKKHPGYQFSLTLRPQNEVYIKLKNKVAL